MQSGRHFLLAMGSCSSAVAASPKIPHRRHQYRSKIPPRTPLAILARMRHILPALLLLAVVGDCPAVPARSR